MQEKELQEIAVQLACAFDAFGLPNDLIQEIYVCFLLLRWADQTEAKLESEAVFEDRQYQPLLPHALRWREWSRLKNPIEMAERLRELTEHLDSVRCAPEHSIAVYLSLLTKPLRRILEVNSTYLIDCVHWIGELPFETPTDRRLLLVMFDKVLADTSRPEDGQFSTPESIAQLMVALASPRPGNRVYDPCFGSGRILVEAWREAEANRGDNHPSGPLMEVAGIELNASTFLIGLTRMILAGIESSHLEIGNSLEREAGVSPERNGYDIALANPPFGVKVISMDKGGNLAIKSHPVFHILSNDVTGLFIQHVLSQLAPQGRAVIAVPEGFLFKGGAERDLRRHLIERGQVEAVVKLPAGAFLPFRSVKMCLLVLNKQGGAAQVRMVDAAPIFETRSGRKAPFIYPVVARQLAEFIRRPKLSKTIKGIQSDEPGSGLISRHVWDETTEDLAATDWDLTPRHREKGGMEHMLGTLQGALAESVVVTLSSVAQVIAGRAIKSSDLVDKPQGERPVGYLRIRDIGHSKVNRCSSWLTPELADIERRWSVFPGDLLVSKSGTIGKVALVRDGAAGSVAANGLYVLRSDQQRLDPSYLLAYLASHTCQNWLAAMSRGTVIQHINREALDKLPLLLPPLAIQARAAAQHRDFGTDVFTFLAQVTGTSESNRLTAWLADLSSGVPTFVEALDSTPALSLLEPLIALAKTAHIWVQQEQIEGQPLRWLVPLIDALLPLADVAQIPEGPGLLTVLQVAERSLRVVLEQAAGHLPTESQARDIAEKLQCWMRAAISDLTDHCKIEVFAGQNQLVAGSFVEFAVDLINKSLLPLRTFRIETSPDWGIAQSPYLAEGRTLMLNLRGEVPKHADSLSLQLNWSARNLIGQEVNGIVELALHIVEPIQLINTSTIELGGSPYVTGSPLEPQYGHSVFFGRERLIEQISRQIATHGNVVLLEGNRRAGKTSILKHLEGRTAVPSWLAVYSSLQGAEGAAQAAGVPTPEVFREIARSIATALTKLNIDTPLPNGNTIAAGKAALGVARACREGIGSEAPFADFREYLELVLLVLEPLGLGLLLMLDEFDKLQEGIDNSVTSPQVPENLRFLIQTYPKFSAILTGSRRLKRLREEYWTALYGLGTNIPVSALDVESARRVVTEPVQDKLTYSKEAIDRVVEITARQPYLMQCMCNRVFDYAVQSKARSITLGVVNEVAASLVRDNEHFASLWDYAGKGPDTGRLRRQLILLLCALNFKQGTHINFSALQEQLTQRGVDVDDESLITDLAYLRELELIDLSGEIGDGHYHLAVPLMADWIEQQQDAEVVKIRARTEAEEENE